MRSVLVRDGASVESAGLRRPLAWAVLSPAVLLVVALLTGCESLGGTPKVENPVFGPPPPRVSMTNDRADGVAYVNNTLDPRVNDVEPGGIVPVEFRSQNDATESKELTGSQVVATVNGQPIFAGEVLERYGRQLEQARLKAPPAEYRKLCDELIKRDLPSHIDRRLLIQTLRAELKKEQLEMLQAHLDKTFAEHVNELKQQLGVTTTGELEEKLMESEKTSLAALRDAFNNQRMAVEFMAVKSKTEQEIGRQELLQYYQDHLADYSFPAQVKWQQIEISFAKHGDKEQAFEVLQQAIADLKANVDFGDVAEKYSDGPTAKNRGVWNWTQAGSLADKQIESALFELPPGHISQVYDGERSYQLVKVVDRKEAGAKPFFELQDEIREKLMSEAREAARKKVLEDLRASAVIETAFGTE